MPQYIMPGKTPEFFELDEFTQGYIEAALWTEEESLTDEIEKQGLPRAYCTPGFTDLAPETLKAMIADCETFLKQNSYLIQQEIERSPNPFRPLTLPSAGHDFWLTRNGHGAGFWDGDWPHYGDILTEMCKKFPNIDLYLGDDGKIYSS